MKAFTELLTRLQNSPNHISPSAYDTAWLAWLYPEARDWLVSNQRPDGSWGAEVEYFHDRVICTLSAVNAIAATSTSNSELKQIEYGIDYLKGAIPCLGEDVFETVGFEMLLPSLVKMGQKLGLNYDCLARLIEPQMPKYYQKLALMPKVMIYSPDMTFPHSLEFIGFEDLDHSAIAALRSENGSIHNSPSATAFVEIATNGSVAGKAYLDNLIRDYGGTAPGFAPFELYEIIWTLYHISLHTDLKSLRPLIDPMIELLQNAWRETGVGFSKTFITDPDDTSLALSILNKLSVYQNPTVLQAYEVGDHFQCFPLERNLSLDVHIHVVEALKEAPDFPHRDDMLLKALNILGRDLTTDYIVDKWHISPYYSTSHAVISLTGLADNIIQKQIKWLLKTQREDGCWTFYPDCPAAAIEETAHTLLALITVYEKNGNVDPEVIDRGFRYLKEHYRPAVELPTLWIHKALNNPYYIVDSVIQTAMAKYEALARNFSLSIAYN